MPDLDTVYPETANPSPEAVSPPASPDPARRGVGRLLLVLILLLVNSAAMWGQTGWGLEHIVPDTIVGRTALALALAFAAALEMIGVYLANMADQAEAAGLPAGGIRLGSYAVGLFSGGLNFSHFLSVSFAAAVAFGFLSAVSPFLWGIYSRVRRGRAVAPSRRLWHPLKSIGLLRAMAWEGITGEDDGIRLLEFRKSPDVAPVSPGTSSGTGMTVVEIGQEAERLHDQDGLTYEAAARLIGYSASYVYQCRKAAADASIKAIES
jgi:hypothetical protein